MTRTARAVPVRDEGREGMQLIFHDPLSLYKFVDEKMGEIPLGRLFNDDTHRILREQWCASVFGIGYDYYVRPCRVAVEESLENRGIDFLLEAGDKEFSFQTTEAQEEGRERGKEYKEIEQGKVVTHPYTPERGRQEGPDWIVNAIARKAEKHYSDIKDLNLLVYVNFTAHEMHFDEIKKKAKEYRGTFSSIWLLTNSLIATLSPNNDIGDIPGWGKIWDRPEGSTILGSLRPRVWGMEGGKILLAKNKGSRGNQ